MFCHATPLLDGEKKMVRFCESSSLFWKQTEKVILQSFPYWSSALDDVYFSPTDLQTTVENGSCVQKHFTLNMPWISSDEIHMQIRECYFYVDRLHEFTEDTGTEWSRESAFFHQCRWNCAEILRLCFTRFIASTLQQTVSSLIHQQMTHEPVLLIKLVKMTRMVRKHF